MTIDTTNLCSHLQRKLIDEDGINHSLWFVVPFFCMVFCMVFSVFCMVFCMVTSFICDLLAALTYCLFGVHTLPF